MSPSTGLGTGDILILSLGGSLIAPKEGINATFLSDFRMLLTRHIREGKRFVLICGGGKTAREYQGAARDLGELTRDSLDWIGIHATRLNAHLVRTMFGKLAHGRVVSDPKGARGWKTPVLVAAGWKPGCSTDYDAVLLAKALGAKMLVNLSNIDYVYDKDPHAHKDAKPICAMSWKQLRKLVGSRWDPGAHVPFDPVASKGAEKIGLNVIIANGKNLKNLDDIIAGRTFTGTVIQ